MAMVVENGSRVNLSCAARGYPAPTISWTHNDDPITSGPQVMVAPEGDLVIGEVVLMDVGMYKCTAANAVGEIKFNSVMLTVWGKSHTICQL